MPSRPTTAVPGLGPTPVAVELDDSFLPLAAGERYTLRYGIG